MPSPLPSSDDLLTIFERMTRKLREIQVDKDFDAELSRVKSQTHAEMTDTRYFHEIVSLVFDSGFKGSIVEKYKPELGNAFSQYDFRKVAQQDFQNLLAKTPIKNKRKVKGCLKNAMEMTRVVAKYGSFEAYLGSFGDIEHDVEAFLRMQRDMHGRFAYLGPTNFHAFMKYIGFDALKDDLHVRRIMSRLGLISSSKSSQEEILNVAMRIREATHETLRVIDQVFYTYGSADHGRVKIAVCGSIPRCKECYLPEYCTYYQKVHIEASREE